MVEALLYTCLFDRRPDYAGSFALDVAPGRSCSSTEWARACLEDLPAALQWFVQIGWRAVLFLRLGPRRSPDRIAGWEVTERADERTVLRARSPLVDAELVFRVEATRVVWSTAVVYRRRLAAVIWPPVSLLHRPIVRYALRRTARRVR